MEILGGIAGLAAFIITVWLGSTEARLRKMNEQIADKISEKDMERMIDLKQESIKIMQEVIREDIRELHKKLEDVLKYLHKS